VWEGRHNGEVRSLADAVEEDATTQLALLGGSQFRNGGWGWCHGVRARRADGTSEGVSFLCGILLRFADVHKILNISDSGFCTSLDLHQCTTSTSE
jgi:hypothetical protein